MADFTDRFNELLTRTPDSGTALADALGVSKQTISAWKNGTRFPKRPAIRTIAAYFGVGVPWLQGITDDETIGIGMDNSLDSIVATFGPDSPTAKKMREIGEQLTIPGLAALFPDNPDERELMDIFHGLNDNGRHSMLNYARFLNSNPDMKKDAASNDMKG